MQVKKIMTKNPACCTPDSTLQEVAHMMEMYDCGCIPVVESHQSKRPIGTITDRDITIRTISEGKNPIEMKASDIMTKDIVTVTPDTSVDECLNVMENRQIRRILVVDRSNKCVGIVAQADLAEHVTNNSETMNFIREVSESEHEHRGEGRNEYAGFANYDRSPNYERRLQNHERHSFSQHNSPGRPRQKHQRRHVEKESFFNGTTLLTLLGTIGLGAGLSYYLGLGEENKHRTFVNHRTPPRVPSQSNTLNTKTTDVTIHTTPSSTQTTSPFATSTDRTQNRDTITGTVSSFDRTTDDNDLDPLKEIGRKTSNA
jgi:CBS domain-containing protein